MIIKGNGFYGDTEINTKDEAITLILHVLNNYQIGWDVVYAEQLLDEFKLNKDDFKLFDLSFHYGVYRAIYVPSYTEEELIETEREIENRYAIDLISNLSRELAHFIDNGGNYSDIQEIVSVDSLEQLAIKLTDFQRTKKEVGTDFYSELVAVK